MGVKVDKTSLEAGIKRAIDAMGRQALRAVEGVGGEILRIGANGDNFHGPYVPHDVGDLQSSGGVDPDTDHSVIVGYNKVYAARLHEHPEYRFQKGRQGKYLETPIKNNLSVFRQFVADTIRQVFS